MAKQILTCYWHSVAASFCYSWVSHDCHSNSGKSCPIMILYSVRFRVSPLAFHTGLSAVPVYLLPLDFTSYEVWPIFPCFAPCKHSNSTQWVVKQLLDKWIFASAGHGLSHELGNCARRNQVMWREHNTSGWSSLVSISQILHLCTDLCKCLIKRKVFAVQLRWRGISVSAAQWMSQAFQRLFQVCFFCSLSPWWLGVTHVAVKLTVCFQQRSIFLQRWEF